MLNKRLTSEDSLSVCLVKDHYSTLKALHTDLGKMSSCIQNQNNYRLELVLLKVLRGESINVVVYGGSNCAQGMFPIILKDWWSKVITPITGSSLNVKVIGIGGTGSGYYQFCHEIYLKQAETIDLVILETAVNDVMNTVIGMSNVNRNVPLEQLTRQLLNRPNSPAIFYVNLFLISEHNFQCVNLVDYGQDFVSNNYRITTLNLRCLCCHAHKGKFYANPKTYDVHEGLHSKLLGHAQIALMIIHVISSTIARMEKDVESFKLKGFSWFDAVRSNISPLPSPVFIKGKNSPIMSSQCWATLTPDFREDKPRNSLWLRITKNTGFTYFSSFLIGGISYSAENVSRTDAYGGLLGSKANSEVTISFTVTPQLSVGSNSTATVGIVSRCSGTARAVEVWLDDLYNKRVKMPLKSENSQTAVAIVGTHVQPGSHALTMRIVKEGKAVLVGVFVGSSD